MSPAALATLLASGAPAVLVQVAATQGSTPREAGARMVVSSEGTLGTIGGGQLEFLAIRAARELIDRGERTCELKVSLGPGIGQCCGGRTRLHLARLARPDIAALREAALAEAAAWPAVRVFGAGHVGRALAAALALLPLNLRLIDSRAAELDLAATGVDTLLTPVPEAEVRAAPPASAYVVVTHDHGLDFLIAREALARGDAAYVGLIGSATKRATFRKWLVKEGDDPPDIERLTCPIGAGSRPDKRPEVIAAFTATEILEAVCRKDPIHFNGFP